MRVPRVRVPIATVVRLVLVLTFVVGSALLFSNSEKKRAFTPQDKAFYADANTINWVRPGLVIKVLSASIADDGTVKARIKVTDPKGMALDLFGVDTPGDIKASTRFVIGYIPQGKKQYVSYVTRPQTSPITGVTEKQAGSDSTGTWEKAADGEYVYTFKNKVPTGFDKHATHSVGVWATRDLSEFDLTALSNSDSDVLNFVPDGTPVVTTRDIVRDAGCNRCHDPLQAHDERRGVALCIICHQPQSVDPDTGNSVDMPQMIHKIHMGSSLPSVKAGGKYQIIGHSQSVADFSTVVFPADVRNCTVCHDQNSGAAQATAYLKPTMAGCGSCHDNVNFKTGEGHLNLPQVSENQCASCHPVQGETEFDTSIIGAHTIPTASRSLPGTVFDVTDIKDAVAGKKPTVTFTMKEKSGNAITDISAMRVRIQLGGSASDYSKYFSEDLSKAQGANGTYTWTFKNAIPADAKGTWVMGLEAYRNVTLMAGTKKEQAARDAAINKQYYFAVDGSQAVPRRQVVSTDKCNACHGFLSLHGGNRNKVEECVICHNPTVTDGNNPATTVDFAYMVHRIHTGEASTVPYKIGTANLGEARYPGDRRNCAACHIDNPALTAALPLQDGLLSVSNPSGVLSPMGATTAACTGCHTDVATASHALSNTTDKLGEACAACHASGHQFSVEKVHAR